MVSTRPVLDLNYTKGFIKGFITTKLAAHVPKHLINCGVSMRYAPECGDEYQIAIYCKIRTYSNPSASIGKFIPGEVFADPLKLNEECNRLSKLVIRMMGFNSIRISKYEI